MSRRAGKREGNPGVEMDASFGPIATVPSWSPDQVVLSAPITEEDRVSAGRIQHPHGRSKHGESPPKSLGRHLRLNEFTGHSCSRNQEDKHMSRPDQHQHHPQRSNSGRGQTPGTVVHASGMTSAANPLCAVTTDVAATIVGRSPNTLKRWRYEGVGPEYMFYRGRVRYDVGVLARFNEENTRMPSVRAALEADREDL